MALLEISKLETGYGKKRVLADISMLAEAGEIIAIIGPNGSGKSTILKSIFGLLLPWSGNISFEGSKITGLSPIQLKEMGITYCPQNNRIFKGMTVRENLDIGGMDLSKEERTARTDKVLELFPVLKKKLTNTSDHMSGGEQQMLALAMALLIKPKLLLLDEPSIGLSPDLMQKTFEAIVKINNELGITVLIVEQKVSDILKIATRVYGIKLGEVAFAGNSEELRDDTRKLKELFL